MPKNWQVSIGLNTGFWIFLSVALLLAVGLACGWFKGNKLAMLNYSLTGRDLALKESLSKN